MQPLELLAPARNADTAFEAILHGADAVYMGPPKFGARASASNTLDDFKRVIDFAHQFRVKIYATVNTIFRDSELKDAEHLISDLYKIGTDAIIVQDMGVLRLDIPPIELHASTQCDIQTAAKAKFLEDVGFSRLVLARELTISEIREISQSVSVPIECFIHGALCVSFSGRCHASAICKGRSANRGECSQMCRLPYTLTDNRGRILAKNKHLLSLKDLNAADMAADMADAGVSSFKIEGRLKDTDYVKNVVAYYRSVIDSVIAHNPDKYCRSSFGTSEINFTPNPAKSFNRGFTHYFLNGTRPKEISSPLTPKSQGEIITNIRMLNNADGISFINSKNEYVGVNVNRIERGRIIPSRPVNIPPHTVIHRTYDRLFESILSKPTARRTINFSVTIDKSGISVSDERGVNLRLAMNLTTEQARHHQDISSVLSKTGNTIYRLSKCENRLSPDIFIPASQLSKLKKEILKALDETAATIYSYSYRRRENTAIKYPAAKVDFRENIANEAAARFYKDHGVAEIEYAVESGKEDFQSRKSLVVMTCRHCILREMGKCLKENPHLHKDGPYTLTSAEGQTFHLNFDCKNCRMQLILNK